MSNDTLIKQQGSSSVDNSDESLRNAPHLSNRLGKLGALGSQFSSSDTDIKRVGSFLKQGALAGVLIWITLLFLVFYTSPPESYEYCQGAELNANILAFVVLFVNNGSRLLPLFFRESSQFIKTGAMIGSCTVQAIALTSVGIMIFLPTPVMMDVITNRRVHMIRWVEWTSLAFVMTFLTEGIDLPIHPQAVEVAWGHAWALALSTSAGILFPFCTQLWEWITVFTISMILFFSLYVRLYQRTVRFAKTPKGSNVDEQECHDRVRLSLRLLQACSVMWTLLVLAFILCCFASNFAPKGSIWASPALPLVTESLFEIGSKVWYLILIIEVHELVFDEGARAVRRLEEMRDMMSVVWESSSDVIALCVRGQETINAVVSPTFLHMGDALEESEANEDKIALVFEVTPQAHNPNTPLHRVAAMNVAHRVTRSDLKNQAEILSKYIDDDKESTDQRNVASIAKLLAKAWHFTNRESLVMHDLYRDLPNGEIQTIQCEAKITKLANDAVVVVLRDISERFQRFETEKQLVVAVTERKKDSEANRFARHEVKNSLLAAIGLVDTIKAAMESQDGRDLSGKTKIFPSLQELKSRYTVTQSNITTEQRHDENSEVSQDLPTCMRELDWTLREVLNTMMAEAMTRDVVNEVYQPCHEACDIRSILSDVRNEYAGNVERFPIIESPNILPQLFVDQELLRHIHRNAVSNAVKFGKPMGVVTTRLHYDFFLCELQMSIINEPGKNHAVLVSMNEADTNKVFAPTTTFEVNNEKPSQATDISIRSSSTGDGGWVMQKCANALGGKCTIQFEKNETILNLVCPVEAISVVSDESGVSIKDPALQFSLPKNTWGIALDDSSIQRKLLERFLALAGIDRSRCKILGGTSQEILGFNKFVADLIHENPLDKFILIVDEDLDIIESGRHQRTVSGSKCLEILRKEMKFEDSRRMLCLIRSVHGTIEDIAIYKACAHGFIPKVPIQKDKVLEMIEPWWRARFDTSRRSFSTIASASLDGLEKSSESEDEADVMSIEDLMESIDSIDALLLDQGNKSTELIWPFFRDRLHTLKGDIKTMKQGENVSNIVIAIDKLSSDQTGSELSEQWAFIRSLIFSTM